MSILSFLQTPDGITLATLVLGWLGSRFRGSAKAATIAQVERFAGVAAAAVVTAVRAGVVDGDDAATVERGLGKFRSLMASAGLRVDPAAELRAMHAITEAVARAGQLALELEARRLHDTANAAIARMERLRMPPP